MKFKYQRSNDAYIGGEPNHGAGVFFSDDAWVFNLVVRGRIRSIEAGPFETRSDAQRAAVEAFRRALDAQK